MPENHQDLELKAVDEKYLDQFNDLLTYVFQITESDIEESGFENKREMIRSKKPILELSKVFGFFDGDQLISQIAIYPCEVNIHGRLYKMGGVTGVGTYPEYMNHGLMRRLIHKALVTMREDGQWISYLYPYNIPFYRRKGWEIMSDKLTFKLRDTQLPKNVAVPGVVERLAVDHPDVYTVYDEFARKNHGAMIRNAFHWEEYWRFENKEERTAAVYYDKSGNPTGVLFYWVAEEVFHIKEMFYLDQEARNGLWNFVAAHFSMVYWVKGDIYKNEPLAFLLDDAQITEEITPYYMARIVDVREFLQCFPFEYTPAPFHFEVTDAAAPWNNGIFGIRTDEDQTVEVSDAPIGGKIKLDIQTLTCMMMNYRRPSYLARIERLEADAKTLQTLETALPKMEAYFSDYF